MKKFLAMLLAAMMLFSFAAVASAEEEAGFDEYELGVEGEQEVDFMTMAMVYFQPVDMAPAENATPKEGSDLHIEVSTESLSNLKSCSLSSGTRSRTRSKLLRSLILR